MNGQSKLMRAKQEKLSRQARSMSGIVDENMEMADQVIVSASTEAAFFGLVRSAMAANLRPKAVFAVLMSPTEAAQMLQRKWRQVKLRRSQRDLNMDRQMHLIYEQNILEHRLSRRKMLFDFIQHLSYMLLFLVVIFMQFGTDVGKRYETVNAISEHLFNLKTIEQVEGGAGRGNFAMSLMDITSVDDFWDWTEYALAPTMVASGRVYLRTYNQVVGSLRLQATRVSDDSCEWKMTDAFGRFKLNESKNDVCYGEILTRKPYGPWYDPTRFASENDDTYVVDFGKDPKFAVRRLQELRENGFLSERTRTITLALTLYNNALPMLCFTEIVFNQQPTGAFERDVKVRAFSVQEYLMTSPVLQISFEACFLIWTLAHMAGEITEARTFRDDEGYVDLNKYITRGINFYRGLDWIRFFFCFIGAALWITIVMSNERVFDLDTADFVDLESVAALSRSYTTVTCVVMLSTLLSLLQYSQINDKMSVITKTLGACLSDILYFGALAGLMFFFFSLVGHLLYGPSLVEWSTILSACHIAWQLLMGEYPITEMQPAAEGTVERLVLNLYFYSYMALMLLVLMNLLIAILMDGYSAARQVSETSAEDVLNFNAGPILPYLKRRFWDTITDCVYQIKLYFHQHRIGAEPTKPKHLWTDIMWMDILSIIGSDLKKHHQRFYISTSTVLKEVCRITHCSQAEAARQLHAMFVDRRFREPSDLAKPFTEPTMLSQVKELVATVKAQDLRSRELVQLGVRADTYLHALALAQDERGCDVELPQDLRKPYIVRKKKQKGSQQSPAKSDSVEHLSPSCRSATQSPVDWLPPATVHEQPLGAKDHEHRILSSIARVRTLKSAGVLTSEEVQHLTEWMHMLIVAQETKATAAAKQLLATSMKQLGGDASGDAQTSGYPVYAAQYAALSTMIEQTTPPSVDCIEASEVVALDQQTYPMEHTGALVLSKGAPASSNGQGCSDDALELFAAPPSDPYVEFTLDRVKSPPVVAPSSDPDVELTLDPSTPGTPVEHPRRAPQTQYTADFKTPGSPVYSPAPPPNVGLTPSGFEIRAGTLPPTQQEVHMRAQVALARARAQETSIFIPIGGAANVPQQMQPRQAAPPPRPRRGQQNKAAGSIDTPGGEAPHSMGSCRSSDEDDFYV